MPASFTIKLAADAGILTQDIDNVKEFFRKWFGSGFFDDKFNQQLSNFTPHMVRTLDASLTNADLMVLSGYSDPCVRDDHRPLPAPIVRKCHPYKIYSALLTQSGNDAPTAIILENTLGGNITWHRTSSGIYTGTFANLFSLQDTVLSIETNRVSSIDEWYTYKIYYTDNNTISITTTVTDFTNPNIGYADGLLNYTPVEIKVYY